MDTLRPVSIFDVIGPIMVGPSSSHTAGAVRLGRIARALLGAQPQEVLVELHGSFAETGKGHGTDKAIVAGLLGLDPADERIRHSLQLAAESGIQYTFATIDLGEEAHPNTARLTLKNATEQISLTGASIGGGMVTISNLNGYPMNLNAELDTLIVLADDQPGTINAVTGWLLEHNINVAFFNVTRDMRGGEAIMVIETDQPIPDKLVQIILSFSWVHWARKVLKVSE